MTRYRIVNLGQYTAWDRLPPPSKPAYEPGQYEYQTEEDVAAAAAKLDAAKDAHDALVKTGDTDKINDAFTAYREANDAYNKAYDAYEKEAPLRDQLEKLYADWEIADKELFEAKTKPWGGPGQPPKEFWEDEKRAQKRYDDDKAKMEELWKGWREGHLKWDLWRKYGIGETEYPPDWVEKINEGTAFLFEQAMYVLPFLPYAKGIRTSVPRGAPRVVPKIPVRPPVPTPATPRRFQVVNVPSKAPVVPPQVATPSGGRMIPSLAPGAPPSGGGRPTMPTPGGTGAGGAGGVTPGESDFMKEFKKILPERPPVPTPGAIPPCPGPAPVRPTMHPEESLSEFFKRSAVYDKAWDKWEKCHLEWVTAGPHPPEAGLQLYPPPTGFMPAGPAPSVWPPKPTMTYPYTRIYPPVVSEAPPVPSVAPAPSPAPSIYRPGPAPQSKITEPERPGVATCDTSKGEFPDGHGGCRRSISELPGAVGLGPSTAPYSPTQLTMGIRIMNLGQGRAVENMEGFCRQKQALADKWASLAKEDTDYGDVARDAQTDADECFQEFMDLKAKTQRRAVLEPPKPLGPAAFQAPVFSTPMAQAQGMATQTGMPAAGGVSTETARGGPAYPSVATPGGGGAGGVSVSTAGAVCDTSQGQFPDGHGGCRGSIDTSKAGLIAAAGGLGPSGAAAPYSPTQLTMGIRFRVMNLG